MGIIANASHQGLPDDDFEIALQIVDRKSQTQMLNETPKPHDIPRPKPGSQTLESPNPEGPKPPAEVVTEDPVGFSSNPMYALARAHRGGGVRLLTFG